MKELVRRISEEYKKHTTTSVDTYKKIAKEIIGEFDLPKLTGSEKQIAWAEDIREKALVETVHNFCLEDKAGTYGRKKLTDNAIKAIQITKEKQIRRIEEVTAQTASKWWIDGRYYLDAISTYTTEETEYTLRYDLKSIARHTQKQLDRLELAKQTGETQVIVRDSAQGIVFKITPAGEIVKETI